MEKLKKKIGDLEEISVLDFILMILKIIVIALILFLLFGWIIILNDEESRIQEVCEEEGLEYYYKKIGFFSGEDRCIGIINDSYVIKEIVKINNKIISVEK